MSFRISFVNIIILFKNPLKDLLEGTNEDKEGGKQVMEKKGSEKKDSYVDLPAI